MADFSTPGFFYTPEEQAQAANLARRQAYAQALLKQGSGDPGNAKFGGLRAAGQSILGAYLSNRLDKKQSDLTQEAGSNYTTALGKFLNPDANVSRETPPVPDIQPSPQLSSSAGTGPQTGPAQPMPLPQPGAPSPQVSNMAASGPQQPMPQGQAPAQPAPSQPPNPDQDRINALLSTNNPGLIQQFAPGLVQHQQERQDAASDYARNRAAQVADKQQIALTPEQTQALGFKPGSVVTKDAFGGLHVEQASDLKSQGAVGQQQAEETFKNQLGPTPYQQAELGVQRDTLNKPVALSFGAQLVNPKTGAVVAGGGSPFGNPVTVDPASNSLNAQTGLSQGAINYLQNGTLPRGQAGAAAVQKEVGDWSVKNNINTATLRAQATATNHVVQQNLTRNNQAGILENELAGTIKSVAPIADAIGQGQLNVAGLANVWTGKQINDPNIIAYKDQLLRLRSELAGYNAVAAGKLTDQGTPRVDDGDLREAEGIINNGLNSGGLQGLLNSVGMTTKKNRAVLQNSIDDANQAMWGLFGVDKNYKRQSPALDASNSINGGVPPPKTGATVPTATGPNGQKLYLRNGQWSPQ